MRNKAQNSRKPLQTIIVGLILLTILASCGGKKTEVNLKFVDLVGELDPKGADSITVEKFMKIKSQHPEFFNNWFLEVMQMNNHLSQFKINGQVSDTIKSQMLSVILFKNKWLFKYLDNHYKKYPKLNSDINSAFGKVSEVIPNAKMPVIYRYFSQFSHTNTMSVYDDSSPMLLGYSAEMFMNDTFPAYKDLGVEDFFSRYNSTNYIPKALVWNYLTTYYEKHHTHSNMLEEAIYQGKIWYLMQQVFEDDKLNNVLGYSNEEWKFFEEEESNAWQFLLKENILYQTDAKKYERYFIKGNKTFGLPVEDTPPMLGAYLGYAIVKQYISKTKANIPDLMKETKGTVFLQKSGFNPLR